MSHVPIDRWPQEDNMARSSQGVWTGIIFMAVLFSNLAGMSFEVVELFQPQWNMGTLVRATLLCVVLLGTFFIFIRRMAFRDEKIVERCKEGWTRLRTYLVPLMVFLVVLYIVAPQVFVCLRTEVVWPMRFISWVIFVLGIGLRSWAQQALGAEWSEQIRIRSSHRLIRVGPYKHVRHPIYMSYLPISVGLLGMTGDWLLSMTAAAYAMMSMVRSGVEDVLLASLDGHQKYVESTPSGLPNFVTRRAKIRQLTSLINECRSGITCQSKLYSRKLVELEAELARLESELRRVKKED